MEIVGMPDRKEVCVAGTGAPTTFHDVSRAGSVAAPTLVGSGMAGAGWYFVFVLPSGPLVASARRELGRPIPALSGVTSPYVVVMDVDAGAVPEATFVERTVELLDRSNKVVATLRFQGPPVPRTGASGEEMATVVDCLQSKGLDVELGPGGAAQPFPIERATTAWAACRDVYEKLLRGTGTSAGEMTTQLAMNDCLARAGYVAIFGPNIADQAAFRTAREQCEAT